MTLRPKGGRPCPGQGWPGSARAPRTPLGRSLARFQPGPAQVQARLTGLRISRLAARLDGLAGLAWLFAT